MSVITTTTLSFRNDVLNAPKGQPVLVDFWAAWCGPCKMLSPIVDQIAEEVDGIRVCKVNVDEEPDLVEAYGIEAFPTLLVFKDGELVNQMVGLRPKAAIISMLIG